MEDEEEEEEKKNIHHSLSDFTLRSFTLLHVSSDLTSHWKSFSNKKSIKLFCMVTLLKMCVLGYMTHRTTQRELIPLSVTHVHQHTSEKKS